MPSKFGAIKRAYAYKDIDSFKRNINMYVLSEDSNGKLVVATDTLKQNLKNWLNRYKMMHDTIDIMDGKIVNFAIEFSVVKDRRYDSQSILLEAKDRIAEHLSQPGSFGESLSISEIYSLLNKTVPGIIDTKRIKIIRKTGSNYSSSTFDFDTALTPDGSSMIVPKNVCMELKYGVEDIRGVVI